eukprot:4918700-Amphidinium_carterae.1
MKHVLLTLLVGLPVWVNFFVVVVLTSAVLGTKLRSTCGEVEARRVCLCSRLQGPRHGPRQGPRQGRHGPRHRPQCARQGAPHGAAEGDLCGWPLTADHFGWDCEGGCVHASHPPLAHSNTMQAGLIGSWTLLWLLC